MSITLVVLIGVLFAVGTYLLLHRTMTRIVLGIGVLGHGANLLLVATGARPGDAPIIGRAGAFTDPVPQALVLTAIVIGFSVQAFLLSLAWRHWTIDGDDEVEDDITDRRVARRRADDLADADVHPGDDPTAEDRGDALP